MTAEHAATTNARRHRRGATTTRRVVGPTAPALHSPSPTDNGHLRRESPLDPPPRWYVDCDRLVAQGVGLLRAGIGGALLIAPGIAVRLWAGPNGASPTARALARSTGARDVTIGLLTLADARAGRPMVRSLRLGVAARGTDAMAMLLATRAVPSARRFVGPAIAAAAALLGGVVTREAAADEALAASSAEVV
jgi:hypothetical protein